MFRAKYEPNVTKKPTFSDLKSLVINSGFFSLPVSETPSVSAKAAYIPCMVAFLLNIDHLAVPSTCQVISPEDE